MLVARHLLHDAPELVKAFPWLGSHVVTTDAIPVVLGYSTFLAPGFDCLEPRNRILFGFTMEYGWVLPGRIESVEVEGLDAECVKHGVGCRCHCHDC